MNQEPEQTIYLAKKQYNAIKAVQTFPNPDVKIGMINGKRTRVQLANKITFVKVVDQEKAQWHRVPVGAYIATAEGGFFPTALVAGIVNKRYSENTELGIRTGFIAGTANLGTASVGIRNAEEASKILRENNFEVELPKESNNALALKIAIAKAKIKIAIL